MSVQNILNNMSNLSSDGAGQAVTAGINTISDPQRLAYCLLHPLECTEDISKGEEGGQNGDQFRNTEHMSGLNIAGIVNMVNSFVTLVVACFLAYNFSKDSKMLHKVAHFAGAILAGPYYLLYMIVILKKCAPVEVFSI